MRTTQGLSDGRTIGVGVKGVFVPDFCTPVELVLGEIYGRNGCIRDRNVEIRRRLTIIDEGGLTGYSLEFEVVLLERRGIERE